MVNRVEPKLTPILFEELQSERFVTISTVDFETGGPSVRAISWIFAKDEETLLFAIEQKSRLIKNVKHNSRAVVTLIANESTYAISGQTTIIEEKLEAVPLKLALISLKIDSVRDVMFYGSKISLEPTYEKTYDKQAADRLDQQVVEAMKKV